MHGFTLLEAILAMMLSGIIISISYGLAGYLRTELLSFQTNHRNTMELILLKSVLRNDIDVSHAIMFTEGNNLALIDANGDTVSYKIANQIIRRNADGITDTLDIEATLNPVEFVFIADSLNLIKRFDLKITKPVMLKGMSFYKYYTSSDLINFSQKHEHQADQ